jgi:hypothetical protein
VLRAQVLLQAGWKGGVFWPVHSRLRSSSTRAVDGAPLPIHAAEARRRRVVSSKAKNLVSGCRGKTRASMLNKQGGRSSVKIHSDCVAFTHAFFPTWRGSPQMSDCHLSTADCNTLLFKSPSVHINAGPSRAVTANLSEAERTAFEHLIAHALGETAAVRWVTRTFAAAARRSPL